MKSALLPLLGALALMATPTLASGAEPPGCAEDDGLDAAARRDRGVAHYERGDADGDSSAYANAARCFELAHEVEPSGPVLFNAATAWSEAKEPARAADAYARALAIGGLEPSYAERARAQLTELETRLAVVELAAPSGRRVSVAHVDAELPTSFHLGPGAYELRIDCDDEPLRIPLTARAGDKERLAPACPDTAPPPAPRVARADGPSGLAIAGWTLLGVGAAGGGVAIGLGVATLGARDDFDASGRTDVSAKERGEDLRLGTNIAAFTGLGLGILGGALLLTDVLGEDDDVTVALSPGGASLRVTW